MRDPETVTEPSLFCSSDLKDSVFAGTGLSATLSLPLGAGSSATAPPTARIAPSAKMQRLFIKPVPDFNRYRRMRHLQPGQDAPFRLRRQSKPSLQHSTRGGGGRARSRNAALTLQPGLKRATGGSPSGCG